MLWAAAVRSASCLACSRISLIFWSVSADSSSLSLDLPPVERRILGLGDLAEAVPPGLTRLLLLGDNFSSVDSLSRPGWGVDEMATERSGRAGRLLLPGETTAGLRSEEGVDTTVADKLTAAGTATAGVSLAPAAAAAAAMALAARPRPLPDSEPLNNSSVLDPADSCCSCSSTAWSCLLAAGSSCCTGATAALDGGAISLVLAMSSSSWNSNTSWATFSS